MPNVLNKVLNFVGWETNEELYDEDEYQEEEKAEVQEAPFMQSSGRANRSNKVVNLHSSSQMKVVVTQPESFDDAQEICNHLKSKKPVVVNLEKLPKDIAQRVLDFISGALYALDGSIQRVSNEIFLIAPCNVDIMGELKDDLSSKVMFPWSK